MPEGSLRFEVIVHLSRRYCDERVFESQIWLGGLPPHPHFVKALPADTAAEMRVELRNKSISLPPERLALG